MLKKVILLAGIVMVMSLSGCGNGPTEQDSTGDSTGAVLYEEEQPDNQETEHSEETVRDTASDDTETSVVLTDKGKAFLAQICGELNDFPSEQAMDEKFWRDFLFNSYTGVPSENAVTEQIYREDLGFEETVVKVSLQEAQERAKLVFGVELPDLKPSFEDMEEGQTSFYYEDGYYYIGVSDLPDYQYTFSECVEDKENGANTIVKYTIDFMGESNVGTVTLSILPENNENGFVIRSKTTEFVK